MNQAVIAGIVRHLLTVIGGGFAAKYGIDGDSLDIIIGGASTAIGVIWSIYAKKDHPAG